MQRALRCGWPDAARPALRMARCSTFAEGPMQLAYPVFGVRDDEGSFKDIALGRLSQTEFGGGAVFDYRL